MAEIPLSLGEKTFILHGIDVSIHTNNNNKQRIFALLHFKNL